MYKIYYSVNIALKKETSSYADIVWKHMSGHQEHKNDFSFDIEKAKNESLKDNEIINYIKDQYQLESITVLEIVKIRE
jgi:hypothetical protein